MQEYCGIDLNTKSFYIGSTKEISRRLKEHEKSQRVGENVFWLIGSEHYDPDRAEEQFYLDFYWDSFLCLNLSPNAQLGNHPPEKARRSQKTKDKMSNAMQGNDNGRGNKGSKFYYDPVTLEAKRVSSGDRPPAGWKPGNPKVSGGGFSWWKNSEGKKVKVYPGDDTTGLIPPKLSRKDRRGEVYNSSRRKHF
jgi:hypothetical protein